MLKFPSQKFFALKHLERVLMVVGVVFLLLAYSDPTVNNSKNDSSTKISDVAPTVKQEVKDTINVYRDILHNGIW